MEDKINKLRKIATSIATQDFTIYFFVPDLEGINLSVHEIYLHAQQLLKEGFDVKMLADSENFTTPDWLDDSLTEGLGVTYVGDEGKAKQLQVRPEDFMVIPEVLTNVIKETATLACGRIVLVQSWDAAIGSMHVGLNYPAFNIRNVMTTGTRLSELVSQHMGQGLLVNEYQVGLPKYFKPSNKPVKPIINYVARNANDLTKALKMFYLRYPEMNWLTFQELSGLSREGFAEKIREGFATIWIDRLASFGTVPLEAMASGSLPIAYVPEIGPEYVSEKSGFWFNNIYDLPELIYQVAMHFLEGSIPDSTYQDMEEVATPYRDHLTLPTILSAYTEHFEDRENLFRKTAEKLSDDTQK